MRRRIFQDDKLQADYERDGFVILDNWLPLEAAAHLKEFYYQQNSDLNQGFHATLHSSMTELRRKVSHEINGIFTPIAQQYLQDYKPIFSNYTVKEPDPDSGFDLHLDWTMVDERKFSSITIWTPLQDITDDNGYLWVLRGSHNFEYTIRGGPGLRCYVERPFEQWKETRYEQLILKLKVGQVLIYDHRVFHGSPPNRTDTTRLAINYTMIPQETESWHYQFRGDDKVEIMEVEPDWYNTHILNTEPQGVRSLGFMDVEPIYTTQEQVNNLVK